MNPDPDTPRVPLEADDPYLNQLQLMAESDPELEAWLEHTVFEKPEPAAEPAKSAPTPPARSPAPRST